MANTIDEKRKKAREYIGKLRVIEGEMEIYKEDKRVLRNEFRDNGWLSTHEIQSVVRAYRLVQKANDGKLDLEDLWQNIELFSGHSLSRDLDNEGESP
jgi:hypothetical protein